MAELVYPPVVAAAKTLFKALDLRLDIAGSEHVPTSGGAVLVSNHIGYLDFVFAGFAARPSKRLVRFMAKDSVFKHKISGPLMRGMKHIPVDRKQGEHAFQHALEALRGGEIVGVFPEATISPSFTLKKFKSGAVRMAQEAQVPVLPVALWGTQRVWTKGRKRDLRRRHYPITIRIGEPMTADPAESAVALTERLRERMQGLLEAAQAAYPEGPRGPEDTWWLPAHLGGTAPEPRQA
ncbi:glycerol acyltransferase [Streptomyces xiamenensis]|uniref:Glycerol acyltransferase n=1 Tax=Streptomyces xiamenensis TaxID=408015 RepID=A0A0F7G069_9ACTN|nr:lysophospholipid acyltransferase family protein [Streptomyces xiamenensis]AKG46555.1 glycerol acyltransferase [Streptomyces xiamenensis]